MPEPYFQANGTYPVNAPGTTLSLSVIGDPTPGVFYGRVNGMTQAMFPDRKPVSYGPLRSG